ncbi:unnamed protein product, partial [Prorocentrum cordatum]
SRSTPARPARRRRARPTTVRARGAGALEPGRGHAVATRARKGQAYAYVGHVPLQEEHSRMVKRAGHARPEPLLVFLPRNRRAGRRAAAGPRRRRGAHDPRCCGARARPACGCGPRRSTRASRPGAIASQFFGLPLEPGASEVVVGDALAVVRRELRALGARASAPALVAEGPGPAALGAAGWDAVVVDCFVGKGRSAELVDDIKGLLKPGGMVVHHMWHASPEDRRVAPEFQATLQEYRRSFGPDRVEVQPIFRENPDLRLDDIILVHA